MPTRWRCRVVIECQTCCWMGYPIAGGSKANRLRRCKALHLRPQAATGRPGRYHLGDIPVFKPWEIVELNVVPGKASGFGVASVKKLQTRGTPLRRRGPWNIEAAFEVVNVPDTRNVQISVLNLFAESIEFFSARDISELMFIPDHGYPDIAASEKMLLRRLRHDFLVVPAIPRLIGPISL